MNIILGLLLGWLLFYSHNSCPIKENLINIKEALENRVAYSESKMIINDEYKSDSLIFQNNTNATITIATIQLNVCHYNIYGKTLFNNKDCLKGKAQSEETIKKVVKDLEIENQKRILRNGEIDKCLNKK